MLYMKKIFNHAKPIELPKLERIEIGNPPVRHYRLPTPCGPAYPSVTTVLSSGPNPSLERWKARVGQEEAARVSKFASDQGTAVHEAIEDHCYNKEAGDMMPNVKALFSQLRDFADNHINNIQLIEGQMASSHLEVAGTVDMVAEWDGVLSVIDWKTSKKPKQEHWVHDYFMQESAYAVMYEENGGQPIGQLVTAIACVDGGPQVFIERRDDWIQQFIARRAEFAANQLLTS
jgi:genome maintenance exonuclease 1